MFKKIIIAILICFFANPVWAGVDFDGVDDSADCGSASEIDNLFSGGGGECAWIYPEGWGGGSRGRIFGKSGMHLLQVDNDATFGSGTQCLAFFHQTDGTGGIWETPNNSISLNTWQHVCVSFDKDSLSNDPSIWINGVSQTVTEKQSPSGTIFSDDAAALYILGNSSVGGSRIFNGIIDEVYISTSVLTQAQVDNLYSKVKRMPLQYSPIRYFSTDNLADGSSFDAATIMDLSSYGTGCTGDNGANNTGLTAIAELVLSYVDFDEYVNYEVMAAADTYSGRGIGRGFGRGILR